MEKKYQNIFYTFDTLFGGGIQVLQEPDVDIGDTKDQDNSGSVLVIDSH